MIQAPPFLVSQRLLACLNSRSKDGAKANLKREIEALDKALLPLQAGLSHSSYVGPSPFSVIILSQENAVEFVHVRIGIMYTGLISGCNCADDPTPVDELTEYCEVLLKMDKNASECTFSLLDD